MHVQEQDDVHEQDNVNVQEVGESSSFEDKDATDLDFVQNDYAWSEDEEANTVDYTKDDIWFDGYVDDITIDMDPNAEEDNDGDVTGEDEVALTGPNTSSDEDEARRKMKRMPKSLGFRHEIDMKKPIFTLGLRFSTAALF